ncbi:MAG: YjbF family lipoprotein [Xenophilus sp.]
MFSGPPVVSAPPQNSQFNYLRVHLGGGEAYLALGYVDPLPEGPTEVWYSGSGEVVRTRQGRIVGTTGLSTDWRSVRFSAEPPWAAPAGGAEASAHFTRERDLMPGYRAGIRDEIQRVAIARPAHSRMTQQYATPVQWFEERSTTLPASAALPPARFAVTRIDDQPQVVYSEQCLTQELCLSLERWKPAGGAAAAAGS